MGAPEARAVRDRAGAVVVLRVAEVDVRRPAAVGRDVLEEAVDQAPVPARHRVAGRDPVDRVGSVRVHDRAAVVDEVPARPAVPGLVLRRDDPQDVVVAPRRIVRTGRIGGRGGHTDDEAGKERDRQDPYPLSCRQTPSWK